MSGKWKPARLVAASLFVLLVVAAPAQAAKPKVGLYDCSSSQETYIASVRIKPQGKYLYANERKGDELKNPTRGRYKRSGMKIKWLSGTFKKRDYISTMYFSESSPNGYFSLDRKSDGVWTGISCYWRKK